ncbi:MAG: iron chelate uptake ABC transporter family permease subunit [Planctomycetaceae bacterium]
MTLVPLENVLFAVSRSTFWVTDIQTILVGLVGNSACAILGCFLVLRRMSLLGDAVSHSVLAGIAVAFLISGTTSIMPMFLGALVAGLLAAFLTQTLHEVGNVAEDSSMGIVFTSMFAIGVVVISQLGRVHLDTDCVLYGRLDTVSLDTVQFAGFLVPHAMLRLVPVLMIVVLFTVVFWKELKVTSFDPELATAMGLSAVVMHYLLMSMVATTTVAALHSVGAIVVVAMIIVPAATAHLLTDRLISMLIVAVFCGGISSVLGCLWARWVNSNAAGLMAVVAGVQFGLAVVFAPKRGALSQLIARQKLIFRIVSEDIIAMMYRHAESQAGEKTAKSGAEVARPGDDAGVSRADCLKAAGKRWYGKLAVSQLRRRGFLMENSDGMLFLTERGLDRGRSLVRSHRLWEAYLDENFDLPADHLHEPAERFEHYIGPNLQEKLSQSLDRPSRDPHGRQIPVESPDLPTDETK